MSWESATMDDSDKLLSWLREETIEGDGLKMSLTLAVPGEAIKVADFCIDADILKFALEYVFEVSQTRITLYEAIDRELKKRAFEG